jgi:hypothetical protein
MLAKTPTHTIGYFVISQVSMQVIETPLGILFGMESNRKLVALTSLKILEDRVLAYASKITVRTLYN